MAHIASCMVETDLEKTIAVRTSTNFKPPSPTPDSATSPSTAEQQPYVWRMQQQHTGSGKYGLFPKDRSQQQSGKAVDAEKAKAAMVGQTQNADSMSESGRSSPNNGGGLRVRIKEHGLIRRRKVSVPELGPMTTVQEVAMDSPTIPGRPPIHERSISAPGNSCRQHRLVDVAIPEQETVKEAAEPEPSPRVKAPVHHYHKRSASETPRQTTPDSSKDSSKGLTPLVIPSTQHSLKSGLVRQLSLSRLRSGSTPAEPTHAFRYDETKTRTPYTPLSASTAQATPLTSTTNGTANTASTLPTPISAVTETRPSPVPWENTASETTTKSETVAEGGEGRSTPMGHRRGASESSNIMERGRPRKRGDRPVGATPKRSLSKKEKADEQKMLEEVPSGHRPKDAVTVMSPTELSTLQKQAFGQATRFEVLNMEQVEALSKELRSLDERTEYLRRTHNSLRAGRRNLHSRICQYLRSPRLARFSTDSMLKQEEALAELDMSIDDWVFKLEHAENRRARVRQKLLEHVAAAATLPAGGSTAVASETLQQAMGIRGSPNAPGNISTPPRSPTKSSSTTVASRTESSSPSPQRVVAQVPSTILEHPLVEEEASTEGGAAAGEDSFTSPRSAKKDGADDEAAAARSRVDVESIRIYADSDVYTLLADVEKEITKMGAAAREEQSAPPPPPPAPSSVDNQETQRKERELHRAHSHEILSGRAHSGSTGSATSGDDASRKKASTFLPQTSPPTPVAKGRKEDSGSDGGTSANNNNSSSSSSSSNSAKTNSCESNTITSSGTITATSSTTGTPACSTVLSPGSSSNYSQDSVTSPPGGETLFLTNAVFKG